MDGDRVALDSLLVEHVRPLLALALVLTRHRADAEDLTQNVLVRAYRYGPRVLAAQRPGAYLRQMLVREFLRSSGRGLAPFPRTTASDTVSVRFEDRDEVDRLLVHLPARQRAAVALRYLSDLEYAEIAEMLGCRQATARSLVKRGLDALRSEMQVQPRSVKAGEGAT